MLVIEMAEASIFNELPHERASSFTLTLSVTIGAIAGFAMPGYALAWRQPLLAVQPLVLAALVPVSS